MFLYRFVRRRRRPQILVHSITIEQHLGFLLFLARLLALTYRLPDSMLVDFRRDLDLQFWRSYMEFAISRPKMVRMPRNGKQIYWLNPRPQMWPSDLTLAMTVTFEFSRSNVTLIFDHTYGLLSQNGRADWHWTKGVEVGHSWPWLWPFGDQGQV